MTYGDICRKVPCPACGAPIGTLCGIGAGRLREEPHVERATLASKGNFTSSKKAVSGMMSIFKKR